MISPLQDARLNYRPVPPAIFRNINNIEVSLGEQTSASSDSEALRDLFPQTFGQPIATFSLAEKQVDIHPLNVGVVLSGGQAPGGHNVIAGLFDALKTMNPDNVLYGFLNGPDGIIKNNTIKISEKFLAPYRNQGGFDMIGSSRTKIESPEQFEASKKAVTDLNLDGIVIIGGDDSNTNAAMLTEYFKSEGVATSVVGVPKTIDGDLKNEYIEASFGFDTACKVYSELVGNIARDSMSAKKYTFFIRLMGRSASHITLECALQTHPNVTIIGEEIAEKNSTLADITSEIVDVLCRRANAGKNYGVILVPEGLIEFIPEFRTLIDELNDILASTEDDIPNKISYVSRKMGPKALACFKTIPEEIQKQLLFDRDPHGNVQVSRIETEKLLIATVKKELAKRKKDGTFSGKFNAQSSFFGYEGRSGLPSNFDSTYCYSLGYTAATLVRSGLSGYMSCIRNLAKSSSEWEAMGIPITMMMDMEHRQGSSKPVIRKALVDLKGRIFESFKESRNSWAIDDTYRYPGPIQFFGDNAVTNISTISLGLESAQ